MFLLLASQTVIHAQEVKRWAVGLQGQNILHSIFGENGRNDKAEVSLMPSIAYNISPYLSAGVSAVISIKGHDIYSMMGGEAFISAHSPRFKGFSLSLSPVFGMGTIPGGYTYETEYRRMGEPDSPTKTVRYRYYAGIRPTLNLHFNSSWALHLGYGFWGYRSIDIPESEISSSVIQNNPKSYWGFSDSPSYANGLRLGVSYSF